MKEKTKELNISNTILGKNSDFHGNMDFIGTITVEGSFEGNISGEGTVIVHRTGVLKSDVYASDVIIYGKVNGYISAENKICIFNSGKIYGGIEAPTIRIEKGASISGTCHTRKVSKPNSNDPAIIPMRMKG